MNGIKTDYLSMARSAADLLREPVVAAAWSSPSTLAEFSVGGLAAHLANQILIVPQALAAPVPQERPLTLLENYRKAQWIGADLDAEVNVRVRDSGEKVAAEGPAVLIARVDATIEELPQSLTAAGDRVVGLPWSGRPLTLDDLLITRMMELAVHSDDLAVSVSVPTPELPGSVVDTVIDLLSRLAVQRHGATAVLRALSRAERAPATIAAI
ncbi:maleylpyruvate isomerase N-terminal domain-containing protein [Sphaerimonospora cavernae]|uniref:Maleylpyruvate isomerase N-terminal domain-containing protein n=1 Tax=Sphaerimonospora cavernae TaxID=1740611 RepID=A0ABV6UCW4_9ACTN